MFVGVTLQQVRDFEAELRSHLGRLEPGEVSLSEAPAMWRAYDAIERLAASAKTLLAERVDESRVWAREGDRSGAEYLARRAGTSVGAARVGLETSKKLRKLPQTKAALRRGELSRPQAESITDAAAQNPPAERRLIDAARRTTLSDLREQCGRAKAAGDPDREATYRRIHKERRLRRFTDAEGAWNLQARGTPDAGALVNAALEPIIDGIFQTARRTGRHESRETYAFDALLELARRAHSTTRPRSGDSPDNNTPADSPAFRNRDGDTIADTATADTATVDPTAVPAPAARTSDDSDHAADPSLAVPAAHVTNPDLAAPSRPPRRSSPTAPRYLALLRIDVEALVRGRAHGEELCEITGVGPVPARVARDLLGDAIIKLVITRGVDVASVTHLGRGPTAAQRIALLWTSPRCTNQACSHTLAIQHDHREPWTQVHETTIDNLDRLCPPCHRRKTNDGWALVQGEGRRLLVSPDDPRHPANSPPRSTPPEPSLQAAGDPPAAEATSPRSDAPTIFDSDAA